jgi:hypothetical protein
MQSKTTIVIIALSFGLLSTSSAWALRCGNALINKGDPKSKVLRYCGEPGQMTKRWGVRNGFTGQRNSGISINGSAGVEGERFFFTGRNEVIVEDWVYNFGPNKLMRRIRIADGIVETIETLQYGYHEKK